MNGGQSNVDLSDLKNLVDIGFEDEIISMINKNKITQTYPIHTTGSINWSILSYCLYIGKIKSFEKLLSKGEIYSKDVHTVFETLIRTKLDVSEIIDILDCYDIIVNKYHLRLLLYSHFDDMIFKYILNRLDPSDIEDNFLDSPEFIVCYTNPNAARCMMIINWRYSCNNVISQKFMKSVFAYSVNNKWKEITSKLESLGVVYQSASLGIRLENQMDSPYY